MLSNLLRVWQPLVLRGSELRHFHLVISCRVTYVDFAASTMEETQKTRAMEVVNPCSQIPVAFAPMRREHFNDMYR